MFLFHVSFGLAQDTLTQSSIQQETKRFDALAKNAGNTKAMLAKRSAQYLDKLKKQELRLQKKVWKKDSILAKQIFGGVEEKYQKLTQAPAALSKFSSVYSGKLDSLTTTLHFLKAGQVLNGDQIKKVLDQYNSLQDQFNQAERIQTFITARQKILKEQLQNLGMLKELRGFQKEVFYYKAQVREYKELWENPSKLEAKLLELMVKAPAFKEFFAQNSMLGSLFPISGSSGVSSVSLAGLQTRAMVNQSLIDRFGSGPNTTRMLQQNMQAAQAQLGELKNKLAELSTGSYGNSDDVEMPQGFKPNTQRTKSFLQRLEYGANIQSGRGNQYFPVTSDLGLSLGYKINDNNSIGIGASYKLGWGKSWDRINITHQGLGLRSYVDLKLKGSFFISGGYEQNYRSEIRSIDQLKDYSAWQSSGLLGLSKKYKLKGKMKGEMKLLWDFLSYQQVPRTQAVLFRIGYSLK